MTMRKFIQRMFARKPQQPDLAAMPPRPFVDTPEAWEARKVIPGESREEARKRLAKYRKMDG